MLFCNCFKSYKVKYINPNTGSSINSVAHICLSPCNILFLSFSNSFFILSDNSEL